MENITWAVLIVMSTWANEMIIFWILYDEQMSKKVRLEQQPVKLNCYYTPGI